jgi:hypothetical protein
VVTLSRRLRGRRERGRVGRAPTRQVDSIGLGWAAPTPPDPAELRELEEQLAIETVKRAARAGPMAEMLRDFWGSAPEAMEILKPFLLRGP